MPTPLAKAFSAIDSVKRLLADRLSPAGMKETLTQSAGKLQAFNEDLSTASSKSVLISDEQKQAANIRTTDAMTGVLAGFGGMIVPAAAIMSPKSLKAVQAAIDSGQADMAYASTKVYHDPIDNILKMVIPDDPGQLKKGMSGRSPQGDFYPKKDGLSVGELVDTSRYPKMLQEFFDAHTVTRTVKPGASYSFANNNIRVGPSTSADDLASKMFHEMQHGSQALFDMSRGGNPERFFNDYAKYSTAKTLVDQKLLATGNSMEAIQGAARAAPLPQSLTSSPASMIDDPQYLLSVKKMLRQMELQAHKNYSTIPGEAEARLVQTQMATGDYMSHPSKMLDVTVADMLKHQTGKVGQVDADPVSRTIIDVLLGYNTGVKP